MSGDKTAVIIVAAGSGSRMGSGAPKQFRELGGKPMLFWSLQAFSQNPEITEIVIVTRADRISYCWDEIVKRNRISKVSAIVAGGGERRESVRNGLAALSKEVSAVLVHDGARPFVSQTLISRTAVLARARKACTAAVAVKDTIKHCENGVFTATPDRSRLYAVQTPQGFSKELLIQAHQEAEACGFNGTDDTVLVEKLGEKVYLVEGEYSNIKITTEEDMVMGEVILKQQHETEPAENSADRQPQLAGPEIRVGTGYDVHAFAAERKLILGGVEIPHSQGLLGHSDADVLVHAVMDALLGACAMGDIGRHFPDSDPAYKGVSSMKLLSHVAGLLAARQWRVGNLDCVVIAQQPKIAPYIEEMRKNIAGVLSISAEQVNIKGTTTERLGFCGREEGIAAQTVASLLK